MASERDLELMKEALEKKNAEDAKRARRNQPHGPHGEDDLDGEALIQDGQHELIQPNIVSPAEHQDSYSVRDKSSGHGKKTADKWNQ